jgi:hypothetical protein
MSQWLRQSTAGQEISFGQALDITDGDTEEPGLTIANTDIKLHKEGATTLASKNAGGATYISNGVYYAVLDATDSDTLGKLSIYIHVAGALSMKEEYMVLPAMIYDSLVLGTDDLDTNVIKVSDTAQTANDNGADINTLLARIIGTLAAGTHNPATAAQIAVLSDWIDGGRLDLILDAAATEVKQDIIDANVAAILIDTAEIGTAGAGLTDLGGMSITMKAEVLTEVVKVLTTQMTEAYAADGVAPTPAQSLMLIQQVLTDFAIAGTVITVKELDGTTTAATLTLDSSTVPTSSTRAT